MSKPKPTLVYDLEIYIDYFLCSFRNIDTGNVREFEMFDGHAFDVDTVRKILKQSLIVGFNSNNFDLPLLSMVLSGADCAKVKRAADAIILNNMRSWQLEKKFNFKTVSVDHIDLIDVAPGMASLKIYGGRMHCPKMQDLPIDPSASISAEQRSELRQYCRNDLGVTEMLYRKLQPQIKLRGDMSAQYGMDLRSKSDAQIAEYVIKAKVSEITGRDVVRPEIDTGTKYRYKAPVYIKFHGEQLREILDNLHTSDFTVLDSGKVDEPAWMKKLKVNIGNSSYTMGVGGLHSTESCAAHHADEDTVLMDRDVASYYPNIILTLGLKPRHLGDAFTKVYAGLVARRLEAKRMSSQIEKRIKEIERRLNEIQNLSP